MPSSSTPITARSCGSTRTGAFPEDNPFVGTAGALPEIWSLGHRNPQGLTLGADGTLWEHEHGPFGGDEINIIRRGANYGWPAITYGREYEGGPVGEGLTAKEGMEQPVHYFIPSIAPSGMTFYTGDAFPGWRGNLFIGAMGLTHLGRYVLPRRHPRPRGAASSTGCRGGCGP